MNFLAHLYLSGESPKNLVGNFIGDFVKGRQIDDYHPEIAQGIQLHRSIDHFTDRHPIVAKSKDKLRERYRHYSGVIVDMFYDHFLAKNWKEFHELSLEKFAENSYNTILKYHNILPERVRFMLKPMIEHNWLVAYARKEGIRAALQGMSRRTTFDSQMDRAIEELNLYYHTFEKEFLLFFPDLEKHAKTFLTG